MNFWKLFQLEPTSAKPELGTLFTALDDQLSGFSEAEIKHLTGLAGLLGKVAYSDKDISKVELEEIKNILGRETKLSTTHCDILLEVLKTHTTALSGLEDYQYTRILDETLSREEKCAVLALLFSVAGADDSISSEEDRSINLIAKGLHLPHSDYIDARRPFLDKLDALKVK